MHHNLIQCVYETFLTYRHRFWRRRRKKRRKRRRRKMRKKGEAEREEKVAVII
jgi:hypothetical protein